MIFFAVSCNSRATKVRSAMDTKLLAVRHWGWIVVLMAAVATGADRIVGVRKELPQLRSKHARMIDTSLDSRFGDLPLGFEPNKGQADPRLSFLTRGQGYS